MYKVYPKGPEPTFGWLWEKASAFSWSEQEDSGLGRTNLMVRAHGNKPLGELLWWSSYKGH